MSQIEILPQTYHIGSKEVSSWGEILKRRAPLIVGVMASEKDALNRQFLNIISSKAKCIK